MGMGFPFGSARRSGACPDITSPPPMTELPKGPAPGDPVPSRFRIVRAYADETLVAAEIVWPDARNYDGRKIAVYRCELRWLATAEELDPHFAEVRGPLVPIARFEPTEDGWRMACQLVRRTK